jgi:uncharacterized membrane protein (UPF0127 family)
LLAIGVLPADTCGKELICGYPADGQVTIRRAGEIRATFRVARAQTASQRRRGLMGCRRLDPGTGLLFVYDDVRPRVFWMKNTPLELAIVFVAANGDIVGIGHGVPHRLDRIPSPGPVALVLEINYAASRELQVGDRLDWQAPPPTP